MLAIVRFRDRIGARPQTFLQGIDVPAWRRSVPRRSRPMKKIGFIVGLLFVASSARAQICPKVVYSTPTATLKSLVAAVNCLAAGSGEAPKAVQAKSTQPNSGVQVD